MYWTDRNQAQAELILSHYRLEKGGEGSKGGHVIGHTRSGKAIYSDGGGHENYSRYDHMDAAKEHEKQSIAHDKNNNKEKAEHHNKQSNKHYVMVDEE